MLQSETTRKKGCLTCKEIGDSTMPGRDDRSANNVGVLRLFLALSVAFTHSFNFVDGDSSREPLVRAFHNLSIADLAVEGFFLLSGYLVTKSLLQSGSTSQYLGKRVLRIYPGYILACGVSLLIGLAAGGVLPPFSYQTIPALFINLLFFRGVHLPNAFSNVPFPGINGAMWTLAYEFRCYVSLVILRSLGAFKNRYVMGGIAAVSLVLSVWGGAMPVEGSFDWFFGDPHFTARYFALFLTGSVFYLFRDKIQYNGIFALLCFTALLPLQYFSSIATIAVAVLGGYALLWFAFCGPRSTRLGFFNKVDMSYGFYLYAWPIGNLIVFFDRGISVWELFLCSIVIGLSFAYVSWISVEKPALALKRYLVPEHGFGVAAPREFEVR